MDIADEVGSLFQRDHCGYSISSGIEDTVHNKTSYHFISISSFFLIHSFLDFHLISPSSIEHYSQ